MEGQKTQWPKDRRTENTMTKRQKNRKHNGQKTEGQKTQGPKDRRTENTMAKKKVQKDKQRSKNIHITLKIE